jgi:hypothetical protein
MLGTTNKLDIRNLIRNRAPSLRYSLALCFLSGGLLAASATVASDTIPTAIGSSKVKITGSGFDFGGETFVAGAPTDTGYIHWFLANGEITATLAGYLHLSDVQGLCGRMRMDFYSGAHIYLTTKYGGQVCASDDKHHYWSVELHPYTSNKINEVKVSIEKLTATKDWSIVGSDTVKLITTHDPIKITADGFDFGGKTFVAGAPTDAGEVAWSWAGGQVKPRVTGTLHINNAASACARMRIQYYAADDALLADEYGGKVCAPDNRHHSWTVDLDPYASGKLAHITVSLQTLGADSTWRTIGSSNASYVWAFQLCGGRCPPPLLK